MGEDGRILGINKRYYPVENFICDIATVCVPVAGQIGDYAAYVGHGSPEFVARHGDKISFKEAERQFPGLEESKYRD